LIYHPTLEVLYPSYEEKMLKFWSSYYFRWYPHLAKESVADISQRLVEEANRRQQELENELAKYKVKYKMIKSSNKKQHRRSTAQRLKCDAV